MKTTLRVACLSLLAILAAAQAPTAMADPRWDGGHHDDWRWHGGGGHGGGWHGDGWHGGGWHGGGWHGGGWHGGFHPHDIDRWHGGYWHHGYYGGHFGWWWVVGGIWYLYPQPIYPYPDPYTPPVPVVPAAPVPPAGSWYYCSANGQYYPYTPSCPVPWTAVAPR